MYSAQGTQDTAYQCMAVFCWNFTSRTMDMLDNDHAACKSIFKRDCCTIFAGNKRSENR